MDRRPTAILASGVVAFATGYVLWPPRHVYWTQIAPFVGVPATIAIVGLLAALGGMGAATVLRYSVSELVLGGLIAYVVGMWLIERVFVTDSPVHFLLYGGMVVCFGIGAAGGAYFHRRRSK